MISTVTKEAFADELEKIAGLGAQLGKAISTGWHGTAANPQRWLGEGVKILPGMGRAGKAWEYVSSLGGATKHLPVGNKSMTVAGAALMAPQMLNKQDPSGRERSRTERVSGFAGNMLGGLAATGALVGGGVKNPLGLMAGGLFGGLAGERVATTPWALKRKLLRQAPSRPTDEGWTNTAPGGLTTTPDATSGQAQAM